LEKDPLEQNNLADASAYRAKVEELTRLLDKEMHESGDFCDLSKPGWGYPEKLPFKEIQKMKP
jgi:hypothetical protein